jgi:hypothetical protein
MPRHLLLELPLAPDEEEAPPLLLPDVPPAVPPAPALEPVDPVAPPAGEPEV